MKSNSSRFPTIFHLFNFGYADFYWLSRCTFLMYSYLTSVTSLTECSASKKLGGKQLGRKKKGGRNFVHSPLSHFHPNSVGCYKRSWNLSRKFYGGCNRDRIVIYENNALIIVLTLLTSIINMIMHVKLMQSKSKYVFLERIISKELF